LPQGFSNVCFVGELMNTSASSSASVPAARQRPRWILSLTAICFLCGGLMAMQVRAVQQAQENQKQEALGEKISAARLEEMRKRAQKDHEAKEKAETELKKLRSSVQSGYVSKDVALQLTDQVQELRRVAGLTPLRGSGVTITLRDNPEAAKAAAGAFLPGIVHDFDLQQLVHELLSAKAEGIAIRGAGGAPIRITSYTPIRCVGPTIYVNFKPVAAPFTVMAVGEPATLKSALETPGGIVENLKQQTLGVKIAVVKNLNLPAMEGMPTFREGTDPETR
jgi:uncharacterized protein YlxW (UPF0749 family)